MRQIWRILAILLLAAVVFGAAYYMDQRGNRVAVEAGPAAVPETTATEILPTELPEPETTEATIPATTVPEETTQPTETLAQEERFLLTFAGDCTLGANPTNSYAEVGFPKTVGDDYGHPFRNVIDWFENDECTFLNLEGPLTDEGYPVEKTYTFRGPTDYVKILTQNSVEAVSIANNHTMDYGQTGYDATVTTLTNAGVSFVERDKSCVFTTENGLTIGLYGAVYYSLNEKVIAAGISDLKEQGCDLVIFAPHWGTECNYKPTPQQIKVGRAAIDAGADIVWGSHPHTLQPVEEYNGGVIFYSLANFSFGGNSDPMDYDSVMLQQEVIRAADGTVELGERIIVPVSVSSVSGRNNYQPTPYETGSEEYNRVLQKLDGTWK